MPPLKQQDQDVLAEIASTDPHLSLIRDDDPPVSSGRSSTLDPVLAKGQSNVPETAAGVVVDEKDRIKAENKVWRALPTRCDI